MPDLAESVVKHADGVPSSLVEAHLRRMPRAYLERHAPEEIGRHLRLLAQLDEDRPVDVDVRPIDVSSYEVCVVGFDRTGILAAITTALATDECNVLDLQLGTYSPVVPGSDPDGEASRFVDILRVSPSDRGRGGDELARSLRDRLSLAFKHLAEGDILGARSAASESPGMIRGGSRGPFSAGSPWVVKEGMRLGDFLLERKLATGGMSEVYLATQESLKRKAAVKVVSFDSAGPKALEARFAREGLVLGSFQSPNIVPVFASGTSSAANGSVLRWLAMEYLPNGDLASWIRRQGPPSVPLGTRWLLQCLQGLHYAHQHSVVHRDLKPHNLLLTADLDVKISDFGLLKQSTEIDPSVTLQGTIMGTPQYISPEQAMAEDADDRSDLYSLGASFFHLFSGRLPFEERSATALLVRVTQHDPPSLNVVAPDIPRPLAIILGRLMARRPEERYQSALVALDDLRSYIGRGLLSTAVEDLPTLEPPSDDPTEDMTEIFFPTP
ncbi:protein kinase domain-containing protein [Singulisphaera sp. PoT]|uniref:serine/threonine-protein kinase n=1 Tax=Singulisphaera sp. PoT TaxID=3411797 RepID=UPI003BF58BBD